jgi:hypothetical protein
MVFFILIAVFEGEVKILVVEMRGLQNTFQTRILTSPSKTAMRIKKTIN